ncbi:Glycosyl hydrolases family 2, TIM barrel domain [Pseudarcicella hirudinis]|uniref:Glycosyl hydrolases family 2, TIM barrel domain n=1 Tax=Pseudarcicella hirudinis TaxID=1079859 RepID=A0A1I5QY05_9BACT|nr:glycoside hydrolase family 2 TIM barrel-domain containing protein [Pseudarcicella hirudinis]SFP50977.1 Glycosyl hydrolases family 2, TIM barrel domain [Pseudarcicella hirudinis]
MSYHLNLKDRYFFLVELNRTLLLKFFFSGLLSILFLSGCKTDSREKNGLVHIEQHSGKYIVFRNNKPFEIKGASGFTNLEQLSLAGGNTFRTWDTTNLSAILDEASRNHLAVIVGLPMPLNEGEELSFYSNEKAVAQLNAAYTTLVNKFRKHPALLFWCLGNELSFPNKPKYLKFYQSFNDLVDMIHRVDPDHPVTTTMINFHQKNVFNIKFRTDIDIISFNTFGGLRSLSEELKDFEWIWDGPFLVTEWGIDGPWPGHDQTLWGAYIEQTSTKKAEQYLAVYKKFMPVDNPRFLGALVFYWGSKQETTPTWFSLFDENGAASEAVGTMQYIWTNKWPARKPPRIKYMLLDNKGAKDNILYNPHTKVVARVLTDHSDTSHYTYRWHIEPEDWYVYNYVANSRKQKPIDHLFIEEQDTTAIFRAPEREGPYRVFVSVYDRNGLFSTTNTPFYVVEP